MNNAERFQKVLNFEPVDRIPVIEWAPWWDQTLHRWYQEGLPHNLTDNTLIAEHLGLDSMRLYWARALSSALPQPASHGAAVIANENEYLQHKNNNTLFSKQPFDLNDLQQWAPKINTGQTIMWAAFEGFFWHPRNLFGIEPHFYAFYDKPELMHIINRDLLQFHLKTLDRICNVCTPVFISIAEDMSYNHGPMISKDLFYEFLAPYYRQLIPEIKKRGIIPFVDSDGDIYPLIPWLIDVGVEGLLPLERMAGVDINRIRSEFPNFKMIGAFDKTVMHGGETALRKEFERILPVTQSGGYIPGVDHQTPPEVSLDNYRNYVSLLKEYCVSHIQKTKQRLAREANSRNTIVHK